MRRPADRECKNAYSTSQTKQGFAWRRDQPECACPEGKSLPLGKAYPEEERESNGARLRQLVHERQADSVKYAEPPRLRHNRDGRRVDLGGGQMRSAWTGRAMAPFCRRAGASARSRRAKAGRGRNPPPSKRRPSTPQKQASRSIGRRLDLPPRWVPTPAA